jgi:hypothetical protein
MAADAIVRVDFVANTKGLQRGAKEAAGATKGIGSNLAGIGKTLAIAGAAAGLALLGKAARDGFEELKQGQAVAADTAAVIKSTGGAANVTAQHVDDLAGALMRKSGVDDEAIASSENLLLTFTKVQNKVGAGNDIFDQAAKATLDYSVRFKKDLGGSATVVGKALNDPIKGMSALAKVGVTFDEGQRNTIKSLVASGDLLGAQKIILGELKKETGGAAEAYGKTLPGQIDIAKQSYANLTGELMKALLPAFTATLKVLQPMLEWLGKNPGVMKAAAVAVALLATAMIGLSVATTIAAASEVALLAPILIVIGVIAALIVIGVLLWKNWDKITAALSAAWAGIVNAANTMRASIAAAFAALVATLRGIVSGFLAWLRTNWRTIIIILGGPIGLAVVLLARYWAQITSGARAAVDAVKAAWNGLKSWLAGVVGSITSTLGRVTAAFAAIGSAAHDAYASVKSAISSIINYLGDKVSTVRSKAESIANAIKAPLNAFISSWNNLSISVPRITLPSATILGKKIGGGSYGGQTIPFPDIPRLAKGGVLTKPTLFLGGEAGREIVTPEALLRSILADEGRGSSYTLNLYTQRADEAAIAYGFRRLELLEVGR